MRISKKKEAEWKCDPEYSCSVEVTLCVIGGKWKLLIIGQLQRGVSRFGQLRRAIPGVTQTMLTQQLRELEEDGVVSRTIFPEIPPRVEYALTDFGKTLDCVLEVMGAWGERYHAMVREKKRAARGLEAARDLAGDQPVELAPVR
jgi:DNA-binding HxlR family transcriptional regulator